MPSSLFHFFNAPFPTVSAVFGDLSVPDDAAPSPTCWDWGRKSGSSATSSPDPSLRSTGEEPASSDGNGKEKASFNRAPGAEWSAMMRGPMWLRWPTMFDLFFGDWEFPPYDEPFEVTYNRIHPYAAISPSAVNVKIPEFQQFPHPGLPSCPSPNKIKDNEPFELIYGADNRIFAVPISHIDEFWQMNGYGWAIGTSAQTKGSW